MAIATTSQKGRAMRMTKKETTMSKKRFSKAAYSSKVRTHVGFFENRSLTAQKSLLFQTS
jgi:hypothetical protein